jgi:microcystin-dependent protein
MKKLTFLLILLTIAAPVLAQEAMIGEIRMFAGNFAPRGWALCDGQLLPIAQNQALFSILGTTYGGNGITTFALPDLRGRVPLHAGTGPGLSSKTLGQSGGTETVTLTTAQMPAHTHSAQINADSTVAATDNPANALPARNAASTPQYGTSDNTTLSGNALIISPAGGGQAHPNMQPYTTVNYIIALTGVYPSRN